jgi:outer membrane protein assembly factor BamB
MKQFLRPLLLPAALALGVFCPAAAPAQALKPNAGQPALAVELSRNPVNLTDKGIPTDWNVEDKKQKNVKWVAEHGDRGYGNPVVAGGRVYVATNKGKKFRAVLFCFDEKTGKKLWQVEHPMVPPNVDQQAREDGLCSTPTVDGDRVYYVTPSCEVICADVKDGKPLWTYDLMKQQNVYPCIINSCSPLVVGEYVYVVTGNGVDQNDKVAEPKAPSFVAFEKKTGKVKWQSNLPGDKIIHGQWANPVYAEVGGKGQVIFPGGDGVLYSFEPVTGELIWKFRCTPLKGATRQEQKKPNYIVATPVVAGDRVYVALGNAPEAGAGNPVGHLFCVDVTKKGDVSPVNDNFDPKAPENKNSALVWHYGGVVVNPDKGERSIRFGVAIGRVAVADGLLYANEESGYFSCFEAATGKKLWEHDFKNAIWGAPYWVDGKVYVFVENGGVGVFAAGRQLKLLTEPDMDDTVNSTPVVSNGVLFVLTKTKLYAIAGK